MCAMGVIWPWSHLEQEEEKKWERGGKYEVCQRENSSKTARGSDQLSVWVIDVISNRSSHICMNNITIRTPTISEAKAEVEKYVKKIDKHERTRVYIFWSLTLKNNIMVAHAPPQLHFRSTSISTAPAHGICWEETRATRTQVSQPPEKSRKKSHPIGILRSDLNLSETWPRHFHSRVKNIAFCNLNRNPI
jgi:hypothetical protein